MSAPTRSLHKIAAERFKPGDRVVVVGKCADYDNGWDNSWAPDMDKYIGGTYTVKKVGVEVGVVFKEDSGLYGFPAHMLMLRPEKHVDLEPGSTYPDTTCQTTKKETTMSASAIITIERRIFVNGCDLSNVCDDTAFQHIANAEKEIERLKALKAQPKALATRIAKLQEGIDALVEALDARSTK